MEDFRGMPIVEGSTIIYSVKGSTRISTSEATVERIELKPHPWKQGEVSPHLTVRPTGRGTGWRRHYKVPESLGSHMLGRD